jgi:acetyltransferase-like isoleucine patch superfamily enzyme
MSKETGHFKINSVTQREKQSKLTQYQDLVVGKRSFITLMNYEFITTFTSCIPGLMGFALRRLSYPLIFGSVGKGVVFGCNIKCRHPHKIRIGDNVVIDDNCLLDAKGDTNTGITIGNGVFIGRNTILSCKDGDIVLKDRVNIGFNCEIFSSSCVTVEKDTLLAAYCYLIGGGNYDISLSEQPIAERPLFDQTKKLVVGSGSWLGAGVKVLDGVSIGDGVVVGAGAVVTKDIPDNSIAHGIPAKVVKKRR